MKVLFLSWLTENNEQGLKLMMAKLFACLILMFTSFGPQAQSVSATNFPTKPIKIIVPFPAGGTSDVLARLIGQKLGDAWGQIVIVENKPGASGNLGAEMVAHASPDGYTLILMDVGTLAISQTLYTSLPFNVLKDFAPITMVAYSPHLLVASNKTSFNSTAELIAFAKKNPGKLNFASAAGSGSANHLAGVVFAKQAGIEWAYIPYKGGAQAITDLGAGQVDVTFNGMTATYPHVKSGLIKLLAVSSPKRLEALPNTPTVAETLPGFLTGSWQGILAPAGTPAPIIEKLNLQILKIIKTPEIKEALKTAGADAAPTTPQEFARWLQLEVQRSAKVIKDNNIKLD
jgi:tripartite-type tricarboxylate transporter receptor subunit TctC